MLKLYFHQVERAAKKARISLDLAAARAGIDPATIYRWRTGRSRMTEDAAVRMMTAIREHPDAHVQQRL